jgi:type II secretory pathway pseudopilin PulG
MKLIVRKASPQGNAEGGWSLVETLAAVVIIGIGIAIFSRIQTMSRKGSRGNSDMLMAGHLIEKDIDSLRTFIARDTNANWTNFINSTNPYTRTVGRINLRRNRGTAYSPVSPFGSISNVRQVDYVASWGTAKLDTLKVTTYVSKRF